MTDFAPPMNIQDEVMAFLLSSPTPQQIIAFRIVDFIYDHTTLAIKYNHGKV